MKSIFKFLLFKSVGIIMPDLFSDSNRSLSARDIVITLQNGIFNKFEKEMIKNAFIKGFKSRFPYRKRVEKKRNIRKFPNGFRRKSGGDSGDQASDSSISSDDCRSTKSSRPMKYHRSNMSRSTKTILTDFRGALQENDRLTKTSMTDFRRALRENDMIRDCTDNFRKNSFKKILPLPAKETTQPKWQPPPSSHKEKFRSGFLLPSERFNWSVASSNSKKVNGLQSIHVDDIMLNIRCTNKNKKPQETTYSSFGSVQAASPQNNIYSKIQKEKNRAGKLASQSCLHRDVADDSNLLDLIHKIVPPDQMNITAINRSKLPNNKSKPVNHTTHEDDKWDVTSIISTCNNKENVSDTLTDEEIFANDSKERLDQNKVTKQKKVIGDDTTANHQNQKKDKINKKNTSNDKKKKNNDEKKDKQKDTNMKVATEKPALTQNDTSQKTTPPKFFVVTQRLPVQNNASNSIAASNKQISSNERSGSIKANANKAIKSFWDTDVERDLEATLVKKISPLKNGTPVSGHVFENNNSNKERKIVPPPSTKEISVKQAQQNPNKSVKTKVIKVLPKIGKENIEEPKQVESKTTSKIKPKVDRQKTIKKSASNSDPQHLKVHNDTMRIRAQPKINNCDDSDEPVNNSISLVDLSSSRNSNVDKTSLITTKIAVKNKIAARLDSPNNKAENTLLSDLSLTLSSEKAANIQNRKASAPTKVIERKDRQSNVSLTLGSEEKLINNPKPTKITKRNKEVESLIYNSLSLFKGNPFPLTENKLPRSRRRPLCTLCSSSVNLK